MVEQKSQDKKKTPNGIALIILTDFMIGFLIIFINFYITVGGGFFDGVGSGINWYPLIPKVIAGAALMIIAIGVILAKKLFRIAQIVMSSILFFTGAYSFLNISPVTETAFLIVPEIIMALISASIVIYLSLSSKAIKYFV